MLVVFSLLLFFPYNSALENWQIYLCNRFPPSKGDKTCIIDRHPLWFEGLEPSIEEWSKAAQEHVRIMTSVGENDVVSRAPGAKGDEPVFVGCRKPHKSGDKNSYYVNSGSWKPIFKYIKGFADNKVVLKTLFKINRVAPAENGNQISTVDLPTLSFQCINEDAIKPTARTPHYFYPIEVSDFKKPLPIESKEHNLKVDIEWGDWSCCSTCCCPNEFCSIGFGFSKHKCDAIESRQTRVGYVSFMKINTSERIDIANNFTDDNQELLPREIKEAVQEFEEMLMDTTVPSVPIFSHVFFGSAKLRKLEKTLQRIFPEAQRGGTDQVAPTDAHPFGRIGKVIQTRICDNENPQKMVCVENERCKKLWHLRLEFNPSVTSTANPNTTNNAWKDSCLSVDFTDLVITDVEEVFSVIPGLNYRLNFGENLLSEGDTVSWQLGANTIPHYDWTKSCSEQDLVVTPDNRSVIILGITKDFQHVVIAASISSKDTINGYFVKFTVVLSESPSEHKVKIIQWAAVGGGVILVLIGLVSFQIYYEIQKKRKLEDELKKEEEQNEEEGAQNHEHPAPSNVSNPPLLIPINTAKDEVVAV